MAANNVGTKINEAGLWIKDYGTALKHGRIAPYSLTERKARAATRNEPSGPTGAQLNELAALSFHAADCATIFNVLELRLTQYPPDLWRNVYKSLSVLEFLCKRGSDDAATRAKNFIPRLEYLETCFAFVTPDGRDVGANVRHRAGAIRSLLQDENRLAQEREAGKRQAQRLAGLAKEGVSGGGETNGVFDGKGYGNGYGNGNGTFGHKDAAGQQQYSPSAGVNVAAAPTAHQPTPLNTTTNTTATNSTSTTDPKASISPEANARHLAALKRLLALPRNSLCADCALPGPGHRPSWASCSLGVFICMRCAGVHRGLGVHISQVRSCSLDTWLPSQVEFMAACGGNERANAYWEAQLDRNARKVENSSDLDAFLRRKYIEKAFVARDLRWPPMEPCQDDETTRALDEMLNDAERAEKVAARIVAEEAAAEQRRRDEEAARVAQETAAAAAVAVEEERKRAEAAAQQLNLINLIDIDVGNEVETTTGVGVASTPINQGNTLRSTTATAISADPLALLEDAFRMPTTQDNAPETSHQGPKDPFALKATPVDIHSWDMGEQINAVAAKAAAENAAQQEKEKAALERQAAADLNQKAASYHPPWAPAPIFNSASATSNVVNHPTAALPSPPPMLTAGPAAAFNDGFATVPHQFTSSPVLIQQLPTSTSQQNVQQQQKQQNKPKMGGGSNSNSTLSSPSRPLQPHEQRAQQLMLGGLNAFNAHAELVSVRSSTSPLSSSSGAMHINKIGTPPGMTAVTKTPNSAAGTVVAALKK